MKVAVIGSGAWGTALALRLYRNGHTVTLWTHRESRAEEMRQTRRNPRLPEAELPEDMQISADPGCAAGCEMAVFSTPSSVLRQTARQIAPYLDPGAVPVCVTKGIEPVTQLRMSQVIESEIHRQVVVLTGPSHAEEVARDIPTGCLSACPDQNLAEFVQDAFISDPFRVYTSPDIVGAELGGALKNVIALCAGVSDGMGCGDNSKAMLMTRGLTEIARLGLALGARQETFAGLAGVGDLIVTCTSMHSRNRRAGILIGQGVPPQEAMAQIGAVVEGYYAARSAWELGQKLGIQMPITEAAYRVLYEHMPVADAFYFLLHRQKKAESEDAGWI